MPIEILDRWNGSVVYKSDGAGSIHEAVIEAYRGGANLSGANLSGADLSGANLSRADLSGANLSGADLSGANLSGANLSGANLSRADLSGANLSGANLSRANLSGANLSRADLSGANLSGANLSRANLSRANGINKLLTSPLYMLLDQPGKIRAYKLVTADLTGPHYPGLRYEVGIELACEADPDETKPCSYGINLATLDWVMREWSEGFRILVVEHEASDIACIPIGSDGKYRVSRIRVVGEKDLTELGLMSVSTTEAHVSK